MKTKSVLLKDWEVRAIREGNKTRKSFLVKSPFVEWCKTGLGANVELCPHGKVGDILIGKEACNDDHGHITYRSDLPLHWDADQTSHGEEVTLLKSDFRWMSSSSMPREYSRIKLEIKNVDVVNLKDMNNEHAIKEGATKREFEPRHKLPWSRTDGWCMDWSKVGELSRFAGGIWPRNEKKPLTEEDICLGGPRLAFINQWNKDHVKQEDKLSVGDYVWFWVVDFKLV